MTRPIALIALQSSSGRPPLAIHRPPAYNRLQPYKYDRRGHRTLPRQIFATKSIDKLIAESELPEHALKKTLGPVSLTALGIGIGGNPSKITDWKGSPIVDLLLHHGAVAGRPGAGPALAISLVLVAIVCCSPASYELRHTSAETMIHIAFALLRRII